MHSISFADWEGIYRKYKLRAITEFNHSFVEGSWDKSRNLWVLKFENPQTKERFPDVEAEVVVSAVGGFSTPLDSSSVPIKGLPEFKGEMWHSARWNWSADLENKKIAAIGNGCSAFQFVPELAKIKSSHIYNFSCVTCPLLHFLTFLTDSRRLQPEPSLDLRPPAILLLPDDQVDLRPRSGSRPALPVVRLPPLRLPRPRLPQRLGRQVRPGYRGEVVGVLHSEDRAEGVP